MDRARVPERLRPGSCAGPGSGSGRSRAGRGAGRRRSRSPAQRHAPGRGSLRHFGALAPSGTRLMRSTWLDHNRLRNVELHPLGNGRYRVSVDQATYEVEVEPMGEGGLRLATADGKVVTQVTAAEARRFVRVGQRDFVLERVERGSGRTTRAQGGGLE